MNGLFRELAPISQDAWSEIDREAKRTLKTMLGARRIVDFSGPLGWKTGAVNTGRLEPLAALPAGDQVEAGLRRVQSLVELRVPFDLLRSEIEAVDRGATDPDLDPLIAAARGIAKAENRAVFHGYPAAGIAGICEAAGDACLPLSTDYEAYPVVVATALGRLRDSGVGGPYGIALGERCYTGLTETAKSGYPVIEHVRRLLDGPIVWTPALEGAVVVSMRGGDFELTVGQDLSIGYLEHDARRVRLYVQESFAFRVLSPQAAVPLSYAAAAASGGQPPKQRNK
jgi:uncharacterized linocin/CFP29 family protein